jgi:hypothetical protein
MKFCLNTIGPFPADGLAECKPGPPVRKASSQRAPFKAAIQSFESPGTAIIVMQISEVGNSGIGSNER